MPPYSESLCLFCSFLRGWKGGSCWAVRNVARRGDSIFNLTIGFSGINQMCSNACVLRRTAQELWVCHLEL